MTNYPRHLISIADITTEYWDLLYSRCRDIMSRPKDYSDAASDKIMASLFFEPSTRTQMSFQAAQLRLGGKTVGFSDPKMTSGTKGETLADTIRMFSAYADCIVMRSPYEGAALAASLYSDLPIINAGDGGHQHPTQTLTDLTTIAELRGEIGGLTVGLCGDLKYGRTVHSLVSALINFPKINFVLISPPSLAMPEYITWLLDAKSVTWRTESSIEAVLPELDVLYMTRIQRERMGDGASIVYPPEMILTAEKMTRAKPDLCVMHPLPRVNEIETAVDADPRAVYFRQARYGMFIRMALLLEKQNLPRTEPRYYEAATARYCPNPVCITRTNPYLPDRRSPGGFCEYCDAKI